jgi:hypothetical protein
VVSRVAAIVIRAANGDAPLPKDFSATCSALPPLQAVNMRGKEPSLQRPVSHFL